MLKFFQKPAFFSANVSLTSYISTPPQSTAYTAVVD